jgi:antitoxin component YwqK of YwqJK toxin-antitoxin module
MNNIHGQQLDTIVEPDSIIIEYYESGSIYRKLPIVNGLLHGLYQEFVKNGQLIFTQNFYKGQPSGMKNKYNEFGIIVAQYEFDYQNGEINGQAFEFNNDGRLYAEGNYLNGKKIGKWYTYINNKDSYSIHNYENGETHGKYQYFYLNQLASEGNFTNGCPDGVFKTFNEKNELIREEIWRLCHHTIFDTKQYTTDYKQDGTKEKIDGIEYIWFGGRKYDMSKR